MAVTALFEPTTSRVSLAATALGAATWATFLSRRAGTSAWTVVRGGYRVPVAFGVVIGPLYDYEFPVADELPGTVEYRMEPSTGTAEQTSASCSVAGQCWLKFCGFPFLNRRITVTDRAGVARDARGQLLEVVAQRAGIAVQEVMSGQTTEITARTTTWAEWRSLDAALSIGSIIYLHPDEAKLGVPAMYATLTSVKSDPGPRRRAGYQVRYTRLALAECARPGYAYAGSVGTWQTVLNTFSTWQGLLDAYPTWQQVLTLQGSAADVVVT